MSPSFLVSLVLFGVVSAVLLLVRVRARSKRSFATILQIVRELGFAVGGDSELLGIDNRTVQIRQGDKRLEIQTSRLVHAYLRFSGDQRIWQFRQLVGEALATATPLAKSPKE